MRILVTGATGFLGSHLCRRLASAGTRITAMRRVTSDSSQLQNLNLEYCIADLTDAGTLAKAVEGHDVVIHAAGNIRYDADREMQVRINVEGSRALARECRKRGVRRLVHVSSVAAIGIPPRGSVADEQFPFNLERSGLDYHISKKRAEEAVAGETGHGFDAVIVNPGSIFGPFGHKFRGGDMIDKVRRRSLVPYFLGGICVVHVEDVVAGVLAALDLGVSGERYILGGENLSYEELARWSASALGLQRRFFPLRPAITAVAAFLGSPWARCGSRLTAITRATHTLASQNQFYSSAKAERTLGYRPRQFSAILKECIAFFGHSAANPEPLPVSRQI